MHPTGRAIGGRCPLRHGRAIRVLTRATEIRRNSVDGNPHCGGDVAPHHGPTRQYPGVHLRAEPHRSPTASSGAGARTPDFIGGTAGVSVSWAASAAGPELATGIHQYRWRHRPLPDRLADDFPAGGGHHGRPPRGGALDRTPCCTDVGRPIHDGDLAIVSPLRTRTPAGLATR